MWGRLAHCGTSTNEAKPSTPARRQPPRCTSPIIIIYAPQTPTPHFPHAPPSNHRYNTAPPPAHSSPPPPPAGPCPSHADLRPAAVGSYVFGGWKEREGREGKPPSFLLCSLCHKTLKLLVIMRAAHVNKQRIFICLLSSFSSPRYPSTSTGQVHHAGRGTQPFGRGRAATHL